MEPGAEKLKRGVFSNHSSIPTKKKFSSISNAGLSKIVKSPKLPHSVKRFHICTAEPNDEHAVSSFTACPSDIMDG